ncbi:Elongation of very long chain fatty acids protein 1, partial [Melipona quadrifasciata]
FFLQNPATIIFIFTFAYLYFVLRCGQKCMKDKSAYNLHTFTRCYNIFQIVSNGLLAYHVLKHGLYQFFLPGCDVPDPDVPLLAQTKTIEWCILCSKFVDYVETAVLLLEKKKNEITLLHLYRRISAPWITWFVMKYFIAGSSLTFALLNCLVRAMTYTSNLLSSFEPLQTLSNSAKPLIAVVEMVSKRTCLRIPNFISHCVRHVICYRRSCLLQYCTRYKVSSLAVLYQCLELP